MNDKEYTIKEYKGKIKDKDGKKDKFEIVGFKDKDIKITIDKDGKGSKTFKAKVKKIDDKGEVSKTEDELDITVEYEKGTFVDYGKIKKVGNEEVQPANVGFAGNSFRWTFYLGIATLVISLSLLIWWWVSSSRKEDKEEEGL